MENKITSFFRKCDMFEGGYWWIIVLFLLFLVFQDSCNEIEICDWIPFLILLLIICSYENYDCR